MNKEFFVVIRVCKKFILLSAKYSTCFVFLGLVKRKVLVLDLDETLIHSHHAGALRQTVKPGTPPDFILKVTIDRHPVRFFVHKRPHVDYFLEVVSISVFGKARYLRLKDIGIGCRPRDRCRPTFPSTSLCPASVLPNDVTEAKNVMI